ncbi:MAG: hypothetical protein JRG79_02965 [Deltaproteobacteria bacterium]|nr:hypothetical protein [Deltaproteobacteria bacterium]
MVVWEMGTTEKNILKTKVDGFVKSRESRENVIPAKAGIQSIQLLLDAGSSPA